MNVFKTLFSLFSLTAVLMVSLMFMQPAGAQEDEEVMRELVEVQSVEVVHDGEDLRFVIRGEQTDGCAYPLEVEQLLDERDDETIVIFINVVRPVMEVPLGMPCMSEPVAFEQEVTLENEALEIKFDDLRAGFFVVVNNFVAGVSFADAQPTIIRLVPSQLVVETMQMLVATSLPPQFILEVKGYYPNGCEAPDIIRQTVQDNRLIIQIYRALPENIMCTMMLVPFEKQLKIRGDLAGVYILNVNGKEMSYDFDRQSQYPPADGARVQNVIEEVEALVLESFPPQVVLNISGFQPDGCAFPVQADQRQDGNKITIEIYRVLPIDILCPQVIVEYEDSINLGALEAGNYTIDVNGTILEIEL